MKLFSSLRVCLKFSLKAFFVLSLFFFFSCAQDEAEISSASAGLVLDYADNESLPSSRLAVFIQTKNAVQRSESFSAENTELSYVWNVNSPLMFESNGRQYAYNDMMKAPEGEKIPCGKYRIIYNDAGGNSCEYEVQLSYDEALLEKKAGEAEDYIQGKIENLALYDEAGELIYFGKKKSSWNSPSAIQNEYKVAFSMRVCFSNPSNSVICFMPEEFFNEK